MKAFSNKRSESRLAELSVPNMSNDLKVLAIVNPVAGRGRARKIWTFLERKLARSGVEYSVEWTERPGHAIALAGEASAGGFSRVLAVGGDGTLREIVQGTLGSGVEVGLIPAGSGNDFCRTLMIPADPVRALEIALGNSVIQLDVGELNGKAYLNVAGCGIDAEIASLAATKLRFLGGRLSYLASALVQLATHRPRRYDIIVDGRVISTHAYLIAAANGRYYGGGMMIAPDADPSDGMLDICIVRDMTKAEFAANLPRVYSGRHVDHPLVEILRGRRIVLQTDHPVRCQADGEIIASSPAKFEISSHRVTVACPACLKESLKGR